MPFWARKFKEIQQKWRQKNHLFGTPHRSNEELVSPFEIGDGKIKSPLC